MRKAYEFMDLCTKASLKFECYGFEMSSSHLMICVMKWQLSGENWVVSCIPYLLWVAIFLVGWWDTNGERKGSGLSSSQNKCQNYCCAHLWGPNYISLQKKG